MSVVALNYRTPERTARAIECLAGVAPSTKMEVIVVDNASGDGSAEMIRRLQPSARVVETPTNLGFAAGMNAGIRQSSGEYILLLNSDIEACPGSIEALLGYLEEHRDVGLAAPKLIGSDGSVSRTLLVEPTVWRIFVPGLGKSRYKQWCRRLSDQPLHVEATEGAAVIVRRDAVERAGLLDEDFFFYHEIVEWCMRMRDHGLGVVVVPQSVMVHACGGTSSGMMRAARVELKRSEYQLIRKRLGAGICRAAITRDFVSEGLSVVYYGSAVALGLGRSARSREKLDVHRAVWYWLIHAMPSRENSGYRKVLGEWG